MDHVYDDAACDDRRDLTGDIGAYGVHQKEVLRVFLLSHFLDNACGHRKRLNARRADHGGDFILDKQVHDFRKQYTAYGVKHECNETQS